MRRMEAWRFVLDERDGAGNMAADHAVLDAVIAGEQPPTLRLYRWLRPTLSIGISQRHGDFSPALLARADVDLVRRPTGGRGVLHADELTYSIALPPGHPLGRGSILDSYRRISQWLIAALASLGVPTDTPAPLDAHPTDSSAVCFETASDYEITVRLRKLVGSAQMRRNGGVLQHGSIPLTGDPADICALIAYPDRAAQQQAIDLVRAHATTLADVAPQTTLDMLMAALLANVQPHFEADLTPDSLSHDEERAAQAIYNTRYGSSSWTFRR